MHPINGDEEEAATDRDGSRGDNDGMVFPAVDGESLRRDQQRQNAGSTCSAELAEDGPHPLEIGVSSFFVNDADELLGCAINAANQRDSLKDGIQRLP